jgi:Holliday junction resolvase
MGMEISRGTRHSKIIGDFGEYLVCNWLSRSGFEVSRVDHTGIDVVAYNPSTGRRYGITVKSRTRTSGKESESVYVFRKDDRKKLLDACKAFGCEPWIAVYVESECTADLYLTSLANYDSKYRAGDVSAIDAWGMTPTQMQRYVADTEVRHIHIAFEDENWWRLIDEWGENVSPVVAEALAILNGIDRSKLNPSQLLIVDGWLQSLQPERERPFRRPVQEALAPLCVWELGYLRILPRCVQVSSGVHGSPQHDSEASCINLEGSV